MSREPKYGYCSICKEYTKLSFEHVPPRAAFNDKPTRMAKGKNLISQIGKDDLDNIKTKVYQRGAGEYTLCVRCNNTTGRWYGTAYVSFAYQAASILHYTKNNPTLIYPYMIYPLRVYKQIISMFCSANGRGFAKQYEEITKFVLNREKKYLSPEIRVFCYYNPSGRARQTGISSMVSIGSDIQVISEISFFPLGFVMLLDSNPKDLNIVDISDFSRFGYNDWKQLNLQMPAHDIFTYFPGDFRSREEVMETVMKNRAARKR